MPVVHRGAILRFQSDPGAERFSGAYDYWPDGTLVVDGGRVVAIGPAAEVLTGDWAQCPCVIHADALLIPGFVDTHIHYPQTDIIASGGRQLLDWLQDYTFPTEQRFADVAHAAEVADFFLDELARQGTTTAQVFGTVHPQSVDAFFEAARARDLRMICGKPLMDRNCPTALQDTAIDGETQTRALIERWHGQGRLSYALTVRFAPTSTEAQLESASRIANEWPDVLIHSHLAENRAEIEWVKSLFPKARSYLDVYAHYGLLRPQAIYAHCIYLDAEDRRIMAGTGAAAAFSPSSNFYLGSGLFNLDASDEAGLKFALATDVGGGSSFSMLQTMGEAYKVAQLQNQYLSPLRAFYLATLAGAQILGIDDKVGRLAVGSEADFIVLDFCATPLIKRRISQAKNLEEQLRILMTLGDDRAIRQTYVQGRPVKPISAAHGN